LATRTHCARIATLLRQQNISLCALLISRPSYFTVFLHCMLLYSQGVATLRITFHTVSTQHVTLLTLCSYTACYFTHRVFSHCMLLSSQCVLHCMLLYSHCFPTQCAKSQCVPAMHVTLLEVY